MHKIGPFHFDSDSFFLGKPPTQIGFHIDLWWSECCKQYDAPHRLYLHLGKLGFFTIGLPAKGTTRTEELFGVTPNNRWHWDRNQQWRPSQGYTREYRVITYNPNRQWLCSERGCGRLREHRGAHSNQQPKAWQY